jgi:CHAD domain-containing protein
MSYRVRLTEPPAHEVRRIAREQLDRAVARLRDPERDRVTAVHDARKAVKKVRALLRLVRPDLPRATFRTENAALRDAGQLLSAARDADVMAATLEALRERCAGRVPAETFDRARAALASASSAEEPAGDEGGGAAAAAGALEAIAARIETWPLERVRARTLRRGMVTAHAAGRAGRRAAREEPSIEALHEWRKRVKDLWYHQRLLAELWPAVLAAHAAESKTLSELLGDDHDLAVLAAALPADLAVELDAPIAERRAELEAAAFALGARIYAETPKAASRRVRRWQAAAGG